MTGTERPPVGPMEPLERSLTEAMRRTGASMGGVYLLVPGERMLRLAVLRGMPEEFVAPWARVPITTRLPITDAVRENRLVWVSDQEAMARAYPRLALVMPYQFSLAAAPLARWGLLFLFWAAGHSPRLTRRERARVTSACRRLIKVFEDAALHGRPILPPERPRVLSGPGSLDLASAAADFAERLPGGCCALDLEGRVTFVSAEGAALLGCGADLLLGERPWHVLPWLDDPVYEDRYRAAVMSRRPTAITVFRPPDHWLRLDLYPDDTGISIRVHRETTDLEEHRSPPPDRLPGVHAPPRVGQLYRLMHLATVLTEAVSVADVIERVADEILPAFDAQGLVVLHVDEGRLRVAGRRGYAQRDFDHFDGVLLDTMPGAATQALDSGVPTFFASPEEMNRVHPGLPPVTSGKQAWAILPLVVSGRTVGACVVSYDRPHSFPVGERAVLTALAGVIAQAFDRARLFDTKHQVAHGLQEALLPRVLPAVPGLRVHARYLPAAEGMNIGGDFYDLIRLGPAAAVAVIGDVQGHNTAAAALMGQVRTAIHAHTAAGAPPGDVLARTNRLLVDLDADLFTSCLCAHLDLDRHRVRFAAAGHPPPILWQPGHRAQVLDVVPGPPLGIDPGADYPVAEAPLPPDVVLVLYTDGLVETPGSDIDRGITALARALAGTGTGSTELDLEQAAEAALHHPLVPGRHTDDIALLLMQAKGRRGGKNGGSRRSAGGHGT